MTPDLVEDILEAMRFHPSVEAVKREIKVHQLRGLRVHHSLVELL